MPIQNNANAANAADKSLPAVLVSALSVAPSAPAAPAADDISARAARFLSRRRSQDNLMSAALETLSKTFREMIAPQSAQFHVVAVPGVDFGYRTARAGDAAVPSATAGDIVVEVGTEMDLEALVGTDTLADLVCAHIVAQVLYEREADARHASDAGKLTYTTSAMYLLLSNRAVWREAAAPNDVDNVYNYDAILDHSFYRLYTRVDGRLDLNAVLSFEMSMAPALLALEAICTECFEDSPVGWYPLPHTTHDIGLSVSDLVDLGLEATGQEIRPAPVAAIA